MKKNSMHELLWKLDAENSNLRQYLYRYRPNINHLRDEVVNNSQWYSYLDELGDIFEVKDLLPPIPPSVGDIAAVSPLIQQLIPDDVQKYLISVDEYMQQISKPESLPNFHAAAAAARYLGDEHLFKDLMISLFNLGDIRRKTEDVLFKQVDILKEFIEILNAVCCFTEDSCSKKMWDFYGGGSRGYHVGYICGSIHLNPNIIHRIEYRDDFRHFTHLEVSRKDFAVLEIPTTKATEYANEREWRTIQYRSKNRKKGGLYESLFPICEITLGARMIAADANAVIAAARTLPIMPRLYRAKASTATGTATFTREPVDAAV